MVARYHYGAHAGFLAHAHRLFHLRSRRIYHADQSHENEFALKVPAFEIAALDCDAEDAERFLRHTGVRLFDLLDVLFGHGTDFFARHYRNAARQEHIRRALDVCLSHAVVLVDGGHELAHAVEGDFVHSGILRGELAVVAAAVLGILHERGLGGIARKPLGRLFGVVAKRHRAQERPEVLPVRRTLFVDRLKSAIRQIIAFYGHLIEG